MTVLHELQHTCSETKYFAYYAAENVYLLLWQELEPEDGVLRNRIDFSRITFISSPLSYIQERTEQTTNLPTAVH